MNKSLTYYFEDFTRLDEISMNEMESWVAEMPFSQPLHKLHQLKCLRLGIRVEEVQHQNSAYHSTDHDSSDNEKAVENKTKKEPRVVSHKLADDILENSVQEEVEEKNIVPAEKIDLSDRKKKLTKRGKGNKKTKTALEVSHNLASDELENLVQEEVIENLPDYNNILGKELANADIILGDENKVFKDIAKFEDGGTEKVGENLSLPVQEQESEEITIDIELNTTTDVSQESLMSNVKAAETIITYKDKDLEPETTLESLEATADITTFEVIPSPKKDKKAKSKRSKKLRTSKEKSEKSKKKKPKRKKFESKKQKNNKSSKKSQKLVSSQKQPKTKETKIKNKDFEKEIRYIYLEERQPKDFRLYGYEGESEYISWLMQTKTLNKEKKVAVKNKEKKNKKGKKKNKSKRKVNKLVLKTADESVKKRDVIISETLADILAAQGHTKKAKKMYQQLSLIFPEKSSFFASKIKKLKKK